MDGRHRHNMNHAFAASDTQEDAKAAYSGTAARLDRMQLRDKKLLDFKNEFVDGMNLAAPTFFPNGLLIQINNSLATRQIRPKGDLAHRVTETPIRGFWSYWAELMGMEAPGGIR